MQRKTVLYILNFFLFFFSIAVAVTGIIKFPGLLPWLRVDPEALPLDAYTKIHDWLGLGIVLLTFVHLILHWSWIKAMTASLWKQNRNMVLGLGALSLLIIRISAGFPPQVQIIREDPKTEPNINIVEDFTTNLDNLQNTQPLVEGEIILSGIGVFRYDPSEIVSVRPDIFNEGYFSIFDILVYLDDISNIKMEYEFREDLDTYVINSINGESDWWYIAYYDGGWSERNIWRMDHYPYKDRTFIELKQRDTEFLERVYAVFADEVRRREGNNDEIIIPQVIIRGNSFEKVFENVSVKDFNFRNDYLVDGTITALDVVLTLSEMGEITHLLSWYESIGTAGIVKNYFVDSIDGDSSFGRCGYVYETGSTGYYGFKGNHIHIPSDLRILTSPEYVEFYWICI
jgi:hypothetical protein